MEILSKWKVGLIVIGIVVAVLVVRFIIFKNEHYSSYDFESDKTEMDMIIYGYGYYNHLVEESILGGETESELLELINDYRNRDIKILH
ncbi:MAG: hypothetical protein LBC07_06705 [Elusimicrobiota bacterium]|jgi:hypothetical protein|nr:hypothetical protein [Elusimicrobiota bacterium]